MLRRWSLTMLLMAFGMLSVIAYAAEAPPTGGDFKEGVDYKLAPRPRTPNDPSKVEVLEFFSYACPHCYQFEPDLKAWLKKLPKNASFEHYPAIFNDSWALLARGYYTAEALEILDKAHVKFFEYLHLERKKLANEKDMAVFFEQLGIKEADFQKAWNGFSVNLRFGQAKTLANDDPFGITGTPSLVINGKYVVLATTFPRMLATADFLIAKAAAEMGAKP